MNIQFWAIGMAVTVGLSIFAKFCPKKKLIKWVDPFCKMVGLGLSNILLLKLRPRIAQKLEEGLFCTIFDVLAYIPQQIKFHMLSDNKI